MKKNPIRCTTAEMAHLLGIAPRTLRDMTARGCPKNGKDEFIPADVLKWITRPENAPGDETTKIKADLYRAQTELLQTKNAETRAGLITRDAADEGFSFVRDSAVKILREGAARHTNPDIRAEIEAAADDIAAQRPNWGKGTTAGENANDD